MFEASERNSFPRYKYKLIKKWIAAMPDVVERLKAGGIWSLRWMRRRAGRDFDRASFSQGARFGYDLVPQLIERARRNAEAAGVADRVTFEVNDCVTMPQSKFDLVTTFDVVHDAVDPVGLISQSAAR